MLHSPTPATSLNLPDIKVVYPGNGHQTFENSTFVMGQVSYAPKDAVLIIQSQPVTLSAAGYFSHKIELATGQNFLEAYLKTFPTKSEGTSTKKIAFKRWSVISQPPLPVLVEQLGFHNKTLHPKESLGLRAGDEFELSFSATPDVSIWLEIPDIFPEPLHLKPKYPHAKTDRDGYIDNRVAVFQERHQTVQQIPKAGWYSQTIRIPADTPACEAVSMALHLKTKTDPSQEQRVALPGKLSIWDHPRLASIVDNPLLQKEGAVIRKSPPEGDRLTPLKSDTQLLIDGFSDDWLRIRLSPQDTAWVQRSDTQWVSGHIPYDPPYTLISHIDVQGQSSPLSGENSADNRSSDIIMQSASPKQYLPLDITLEEQRLSCQLFGATARKEHEQFTPENPSAFIDSIHWRQERENVLRVEAIFKRDAGHPCGVSYRHSDTGIVLSLRALPVKLSDIVIGLDPGHGGSETGSIGLSGLAEKNLNLQIARLLQQQLYQIGFQHVILSRNSDQELPLPARGQWARQAQPHIILSLHHNALPDGRDPSLYQGACCFYYHPFSKTLAHHIQQAIVNGTGLHDFGVFTESFYMTRIQHSIAVLVELGFFTHPGDYERLLNPQFQNQTTRSIAESLLTFCQNSA